MKIIVTDEQVEEALNWMSENAAYLGEARARMDDAYEDMKSTEALYISSEDGPMDLRRAVARRSQEWKEAKAKKFNWTKKYETTRRIWEVKNQIIEIYRTQEASRRQGNV